ncbi:MAG: hypothetical protein WC556_03330 [Candidatus Methanoperedens sp.]
MEYIETELANLPKNFIVLLVSSSSHYQENNLNILKLLLNDRKMSGIYINVTKSCDNISDLMRSNGIDISRLFFIDCVTLNSGFKPVKKDTCLYVNSPSDLTEISIVLDQLVQTNTTEGKFLFLDSLSTLLIYNSPNITSKFAHFLTVKLRQWKITGILITLEKETDEKLLSLISQFADKIIYPERGYIDGK